LKSKPNIEGYIGYFGLQEWWLSEFSAEEKLYIEERFNPLGFSKSRLTKGKIVSTSETPLGLLSSLAGWFSKKTDLHIAHRILDKAECLIDDSTKILDKHFLYQSRIDLFYKDRDNSQSFEKAVVACKNQIELAQVAAIAFLENKDNRRLPSHKGFEQLCIIKEKSKNYNEVITLSEEALSQGWSGDWERRIERCQKKLEV